MKSRRRSIVLFALASALTVFASSTALAATYSFGDKNGVGPVQNEYPQYPEQQPGPLGRVIVAAHKRLQNGGGCTGLTEKKLAALMLPPTWREIARNGGTPHPMALSRGDFGTKNALLYYDADGSGNGDDHHRIFWHPGLGMWQLDDTNSKGKKLASGRFRPYTSVANLIADAYCADPANVSYSRIYQPWAADDSCGSNGAQCQQIFEQIYDPNSNEFKSELVMNMNVDYYGGILKRRCQFKRKQDHEDPNHNPPQVDCYYVNPLGAGAPYYEGFGSGGTAVDANGGWIHDSDDDVDGGTNRSGPSPLTKPFYILRREPQDGQPRENRVWLKDDLNDASLSGVQFGVTGGRDIGQPSREKLKFTPSTSICDITDGGRRGNC